MERKRNLKNHDSHGQQRHRPLNAYELYELEHRPRTLQMKVSSIDRAKPREDETSRPHYEPGRMVQQSWSQTKDNSHVQRRHRPLNAYELYELEHVPRTLPHVKVPSIDRAKPHEVATSQPHYEPGRTFPNSWSKDDNHGHQRHRPRNAYELYELEHMPRTTHHAKVPSTDRAKPGDQNGQESYKENIDSEAEAFIRSEHEKFELRKWMSITGC